MKNEMRQSTVGKKLVAHSWLLPLLICASSVLLPVPLYARIGEPGVGAIFVLLLAVYGGARLAILSVNGRGRIMQLFFWFYFYFFLALAPLAQMSGAWPWPAVVSDAEVSAASIIVFVAAMAYELTRALVARSAKDFARSTRQPRVLSPRRLAVVVPVMALTSLAVMLYLGGPARLLQPRDSRFAAISEVGSTNATIGLITTALVSTAFVSAYLMVVARRHGVITGWGVPTIFLVALALFVTNPLSTNRYTLISVWAGIFLAYLWPLTRRNFALIAGSMVVGLAVVFPWLNQFRRTTGTTSYSSDIHEQLNHGDYDSFQQITSVVDYVADQGHTLGHQLLSALLFWFPRALWPEKSIDTGVLTARHEGYVFVNLSAPLPSEAYIDFGYPGVVVSFAAIGAFTVWAEKKASDAHTLTSFTGLFVPIFAVYQVIILRGSLLQAISSIAVVAGLLLLATERVPELTSGPEECRGSKVTRRRLRKSRR